MVSGLVAAVGGTGQTAVTNSNDVHKPLPVALHADTPPPKAGGWASTHDRGGHGGDMSSLR